MHKEQWKSIWAMVLCLCLLTTVTGCSPESQYTKANKLLAEGNYAEAAIKFESLGSFEDAPMLTMYAKAVAAGEAGQFDACLQAFETLGDFKDSPLMVNYYTARAYEASGLAAQTPQQQMEQENWTALMNAAELYDQLLLFRDSQTRADNCRQTVYAFAKECAAHEDYSNASTIIGYVSGYLDADQLVVYYNACHHEMLGQYETAAELFEMLGDYAPEGSENGTVRAETARQTGYTAAMALLDEGKYEDGYALLRTLGDYNGATAYVPQHEMQRAQAYLDAGEYEDAINLYRSIEAFAHNNEPGYTVELGQKAILKIKESYYHYGESLLTEGKISYALLAYRAAGDYEQASAKAAILMSKQNQFSVAIAAEGCRSIGLKTGGKVVATGNNDEGECEVEEWKDIVAVAAGGYHTVGLTAYGTVEAVGNNEDNQCEINNWRDITAVKAGYLHTVGLKTDGSVVAVGSNKYGQCEVDDWTNIVAIYTGSYHTLGLKTDGTVVAVGLNQYDQCEVSCWRNIIAASASEMHTIGLRADGTVVAVGRNGDGQCEVDTWKDVISVATGWYHSVGLKADGTVVAVGSNKFDQCEVSNWNDIVAIAAGGWHTIGLKADGSVVAVGLNSWDQCDVSDWYDIGPNISYLNRPMVD